MYRSTSRVKILSGICVLALGALLTGGVWAEDDVAVAVGETLTVAEDAAYGTVTVEGTFLVRPGVTVTVSNLFVGTSANADTAAVVSLGEGARLVVSEWDQDTPERLILGNGGRAEVTLAKGSTLTASECILGMKDDTNGYWTVPTDAEPCVRLTLNNATMDIVRGLCAYCQSTSAEKEAIRVTLNGSETVLRCRDIGLYGKKMQTCFAFNGGCLLFDRWYNWGNSASIKLPWVDNKWNPQSLVLESVDGQPIRIQIAGAKSGNSIFQIKTSASSWITLRGAGAFVPEGLLDRPLFNQDSQGTLRLENGGGILLAQGITMPFNAFSATALSSVTGATVRVGIGGALDLKGCSLSLDAFESVGVVTNTSETAATLTVGKDGGDVTFAAPPAADLVVVKSGTGVLRVPDGVLSNLTVSAGSVEFLNRRDVGFPYYRLWVDEGNQSFYVNEVAFLDGEEDVTGNWTAISRIEKGGHYYGGPTGAVDRVDATTWGDNSLDATWGVKDGRRQRTFFVTHFGGAPVFDFLWYGAVHSAQEVGAEVWYNPVAPQTPASVCQKVTGYRMKRGGGGDSFPVNWRLSGGFAEGPVSNVWQDLDIAHEMTAPDALSWTEERALYYTNAVVRVDALTLADGTTWRLDVKAGQMAIGDLSVAGGGTIALRNFTQLSELFTLPVSVEACATAENLAAWTVVCEGRPNARLRLLWRKGRLCTESTSATLLYIR